MDATSMALCHTKVEEIRRRISEGELTAQQIHDILISEIENELSRPTKEVNILIQAEKVSSNLQQNKMQQK